MAQFGIEVEEKDTGKLIIDVSSEWCMPCRTLDRVLRQFQEEGLIDLIEIDINQHPSFKKALDITSVPTLLFFKDGKLLEKDIGIDGQTLVKKGIMQGTTGELILREIIDKM